MPGFSFVPEGESTPISSDFWNRQCFPTTAKGATLLDATVVRSVLLPATMTLLGDWNWWLPPFLRWLPRVTIEGEPETEPLGVAPLWWRVRPSIARGPGWTIA